MEAVFIKLLNISITAGYLVLAVVLLRLLLKKAPKAIFVAMWALVGLRLIVPFSLESIFSLIPSAEPVPEDIAFVPIPTVQTGVQFFNSTVNPILQQSFAPAPGASVNPMQIVLRIASTLWAVGVAVMLGYCAFSYLRIHRKVWEAAYLKDRIWLCDSISSPFILGLFRPKIYLPSNMNAQDMEYVLAHENAHLKRRDHLWKPLGFLLLAVYWFNPLMWLAYILLCRDIELACDEKVLKQMGSEAKKPYSEALLNCSVKPRMIAACPLAFGEVGVKDRIKSVLNYKKPAFWIIIVAIVLCIAAVAFFFTNPVSTDKKMSAFIESEILKHHQHDDSEDYFCCTNWVAFGKDKDGDTTTLYMWVHYAEFSYDNGVKSGMSALTPTVITIKNNQGNYELVEYWEPRNGAYYDDDILAKFPWYLYPHVFYRDIFVDLDLKACEKKAEEYFSSASIPGVKDQELSPSLKNLYEKYPQYFGLDASGGLDVYVWQMAKGSYSFGVLPHSEEKLDWMSPQLMNMPGVTAYEMRQILSSYALDESAIYIIPWQNPLSSYIGDVWIVDSNTTAEQRQAKYDAYISQIKEMLLGPIGSKELYTIPIQNKIVVDMFGSGVESEWSIAPGLDQSSLLEAFVINVYQNGYLMHEDVFYCGASEYGFAQDENGKVFFLIKDDAKQLGFRYDISIENGEIFLLGEYFYPLVTKVAVAPFYTGLYAESVEYDIDNDGIVETCGWGYGPTSGLFTFTFSVWENQRLEYYNVFQSKHYSLSFKEDSNHVVYLQGTTQVEESQKVRIDLSVEGGNIFLTLDGKRLENWLDRELSKVPMIGEDENSLQFVHSQVYHKTVMAWANTRPSLSALCQLVELDFIKETKYSYTTLFHTEKGYVQFEFSKDGSFIFTQHVTFSENVTQEDMDKICLGMSLDAVEKIDPQGQYIFRYTGSNAPPYISEHYLTSGIYYVIVYDENYNVINIGKSVL